VSSGLFVAVLAGIGSSALGLLCSPTVALAQDAQREPIPLSVDKSTEATQRADETVTYSFSARAGASYLIEVDQRGLDFVVSVEAPNGSTQSYSSPLRRDEREYALLDATATGEYRITVASDEFTRAVGRHAIRVTEFSTAAGFDAAHAEAWRLMTAAAAINVAAERAKLAQTLEQEQVDTLKATSRDSYARAGEQWQQLGEHRLHAQALYSTAMLEYWDLYNWPGAVELAEMAANIYRDVDDDLSVRASFLQAYASVDAAEELDRDDATAAFDKSLRTYSDLAALYERRSDEHALAEVLKFIGYTHWTRGNFTAAEPVWQRSASLFSSIGDWGEELDVRQSLAVIDINQGYLGNAIDTLRYVLAQIPAGKNPGLEADVLENLGAAHRDFGDIDEALEAYSRALILRQNLGDGSHVANSLRGLGSTYYVSGDNERARRYLEQALTAARNAGDGRSQAGILTYLGNIAFLEADYEAALALHRDAEQLTKSTQVRAVRELLIAKDLASSGRHAEALVVAEEVAAASADLPVVLADAHAVIGRNRVATGDYSGGFDHLQQALSLYRSLHHEEGEADALNGLALAAQGAGKVSEAVSYGEAALSRVENLRVKVSAPELRALYSATQRGFYETQIELLMSSGRDTAALSAALTVSERARARMLVDLLAATRVEATDGLDEVSRSRRRQLYDELAARGRQRDRLLADPVADAEASKKLDDLLREMAALENELTLLDTRARLNPAASSKLLTGSQIQQLLDSGTVLLQYELGERRSFVWVVTRDSIDAVELAPRDVIETAVRNALTALHTSTSWPAQRNELLQTLADHVIKPVADLVDGDRVLVAADGALHYVPFAVLPMARDGAPKPLVETHEVINVPSLSALAAQRARRSAEAPSKTLAIFADPVFERADERLRRNGSQIATDARQSEPITRSSLDLRRLQHSAREAHDIAALVPATGRLLSVGFDANRENVINAGLREYRYVHFATHGLVDSRSPALSALALSQFDQRGNALAGYLQLDDIYNLDLNADLVVLSACDTALGREIRGEGLVGLTQAFLYAGTKGLVLSLWQVSDAATATLMTRFYEELIKRGASPDHALSSAQRSMAAEPRWANPYYWGAFVLVGDVQ
jgi:CHAT domain-containing protein